MDQIRFLLTLSILLLASCGASHDSNSEGSSQPKAKPSETDSPKKLHSNCSILVGEECFANAGDACEAAKCPQAHCIILESYPGRVSCDTLPQSLNPQTGKPIALIAYAQGPDDGGGFDIVVGKAGWKEDPMVQVGSKRFYDSQSKTLVEHSLCELPMSEHTRFNFLGKAHDDPWPHTIDNDDKGHLQVFRSCSTKGSTKGCSETSSGGLTLESLEPGKGAKGSYHFESPDGPLEGSFDAVWCGYLPPSP